MKCILNKMGFAGMVRALPFSLRLFRGAVREGCAGRRGAVYAAGAGLALYVPVVLLSLGFGSIVERVLGH